MSDGPEFFQTVMGHRFYEGDVPRLVKALEKIGAAMEEAVRMECEESRAHSPQSPAPAPRSDSNVQAKLSYLLDAVKRFIESVPEHKASCQYKTCDCGADLADLMALRKALLEVGHG